MKIARTGDLEPEHLAHNATNAALHNVADELSIDISMDWLMTSSQENEID